jgi:hypothetical protein
MRYINVSIVPLFLLLSIITALPAHASTDFEGWALKKGGELDSRWNMAVAREAGTPAGFSAGTTAAPMRSTAVSAKRPAFRAARPTRPAAGCLSVIDGSKFTKRGSQDFLWQSTRERNSPSRGVSKLTSPAQAARASALKRRLPSNNAEKYRRTFSTGRASAWRRTLHTGTRLSRSGTHRRASSPSLTRGATRVRRTPHH